MTLKELICMFRVSVADGSRAMTSEGPAVVEAEPHVDPSASPGWDRSVGEEVESVEQEETGPTELREDVGDDVSSELSDLVVPYPELAPIVFFCLKQSTCPRSWCIRLVSSPYPLTSMISNNLLSALMKTS